MIVFQQIASALYLAAGVGGGLAVLLPSDRMERGAVWGLALGAFFQALALATLHRLDPPPEIWDLPIALALMGWVAVIFLLLLMLRVRLPGLPAVAGPVAFLASFVSSLRTPPVDASVFAGGGSLPHAHVLLTSAGLGLLGIAGIAGIFFLVEHRSLKTKRIARRKIKSPSLEALDRVNSIALAIGFPLLTLGVITGALWLESVKGTMWMGSEHEIWTIIAWLIYAGLAGVRFVGRQGARHCAASAVAGFAFLLFAVIGVELLT